MLDIAHLLKIEKDGLDSLETIEDLVSLDDFRVRYLGKKGIVTLQLKELVKLPADERPEVGAKINSIKRLIEEKLSSRRGYIVNRDLNEKLSEENFDIGIPGRKIGYGSFHPVARISKDLIDIFSSLGFSIEEGNEVETDYYNFKALNFPDDHPARDMADTFYINEGRFLLRTHTSPVQIHAMLKRKPPMAIIAPGRVFRRDSDITHSPVFHQLEGFFIDRNLNFGSLVGILELFVKKLYGESSKIRLRPSFFPFTEPSAEVDLSCVICSQRGCRICKNTGWIEILGAGMIDPNVLSECDIDPEKFSGFAFGVGIERIAMLRYMIDDIRLLYENDPRFLSQFR